MEVVAALKPLPGAALGGKPRARCDTGIETLCGSRVQPQYLDVGAPGHTTLEDFLVQLCASAGRRVCAPQCTQLGDGCARWRRSLLRYRPTIGISRLRWARFSRTER